MLALQTTWGCCKIGKLLNAGEVQSIRQTPFFFITKPVSTTAVKSVPIPNSSYRSQKCICIEKISFKERDAQEIPEESTALRPFGLPLNPFVRYSLFVLPERKKQLPHAEAGRHHRQESIQDTQEVKSWTLLHWTLLYTKGIFSKCSQMSRGQRNLAFSWCVSLGALQCFATLTVFVASPKKSPITWSGIHITNISAYSYPCNPAGKSWKRNTKSWNL